MSRRGQHMTWRAYYPTVNDAPELMSDAHLQSLGHWGETLRWITVARGKLEYMKQVAEALNRARFTLFPIRPGARKESDNAHAHDDGTVGDDSERSSKRRRKLPGGQMARRSHAKRRNKPA